MCLYIFFYCPLHLLRICCISLDVFSDRTSVRKSVDKKIVCSANSSQMCSYNWKWFSDQKEVSVSNDKVLNPDRSGSYRCEAECQMRNESCVVVSMIIESVSDSVPSSSANGIDYHLLSIKAYLYIMQWHLTIAAVDRNMVFEKK